MLQISSLQNIYNHSVWQTLGNFQQNSLIGKCHFIKPKLLLQISTAEQIPSALNNESDKDMSFTEQM